MRANALEGLVKKSINDVRNKTVMANYYTEHLPEVPSP